MNNIKDRKFCCILYPDCEEHVNALHYIENHEMWNKVYILHDKDIDDDGNLKKPHYHCVFRFDSRCSPRSVQSVSKELGLRDGILQRCTSFNDSVLYLLHYGDKSKAQYNISELKGNIVDKVSYLFTDTLDPDKVLIDIFSFIDGQSFILYSDLFTFLVDKHYLDIYRKFSYAINNAINQHNYLINIPDNKN